MSTTVDHRVVEMRFDNQHFERNVSTTMSTLDKLKEKLNFTGAAKGLDNLGLSAKNVSMSGLASGVETVRSKFSALEVMGVTALANITNSAVNAGKRIAKSLTVDPIKSGFQEYELKMGSIQTIMASTGESLETVNRYLNELNEYSDKTIYSFQDMTSNIGKFTNAGVKLEDAVMAIKGISNEAAVSGANANEASRAMYNFAQALSAGYVKLIDWKSIENANMATVEFKNELIKTALELGTVSEAADGMYKTLDGNFFSATKNFNEVFQDQWMTSEVLIKTLKNYADETTDIGAKSAKAATEVKTFSMMMDTLKESIQSGWAQTWEIIIGDFEQGKTLWTAVSESLGGMVEAITKSRNNLLTNALTRPGSIEKGWNKIADYVRNAGISMDDFEDSLRNVAREHGVAIDDMIKEEKSLSKTLKKGWLTKDILLETLDKYSLKIGTASNATDDITDKLKYFQNIFDEVWRGNWGNGQSRIEKLTEAGHDYAAIQDLVNRYSAGYKLTLDDLTDVQLESIGYTKEQIEHLREFGNEAGLANVPLEELIDSLTRPTGRELLIESFRNIVEAIKKPIEAMGNAWKTVFGDIDGSKVLYEMIEGFHALTESIIISEETAGKLEKIFEGLFYGGRLLKSVMGKSFVAMLNLASAVLGLFGTNILDLSVIVAEYITKVGKWVDAHTPFIGMMGKVAKVIAAVISGIGKCVSAFLELDVVKDFLDQLGKIIAKVFGVFGEGFDTVGIDSFVERIDAFFQRIADWIKAADDAENIGQYLIEGLKNGIMWGWNEIVGIIKELGNLVINTFKKLFDIHSPSRVMFEIGVNIIQGLIGGIRWLISSLAEVISNLVTEAVEAFKNADFTIAITTFKNAAIEAVKGFMVSFKSGSSDIFNMVVDFGKKVFELAKTINWGKIFAIGLSVGIIKTINRLTDVLEMFGKIPEGIGKMTSGIGTMAIKLGEAGLEMGKAAKRWATGKMILNMAKAIGILALALVLLARTDTDDLWGAFEVLFALTAVIVTLSIVASKLDKATADGELFNKQSLSILAIAGSLAILGLAVKLLSTISSDDMNRAINAMVVMVGGILAIMLLFGKLNKSGKKRGKMQGIEEVGAMLFKMSIALLIMTQVLKMASSLDGRAAIKGIAVIGAVLLMFSGVVKVSQYAGKHASKAGGMLFKMSAAMLIMVWVVKMASKLDKGTIKRGLAFVAGVEALFMAVVIVSKFAGKHAAKAGWMLFGMSFAMLMMISVVKLIAGIDNASIEKGLAVIGLLGVMFGALISVAKKSGKHAAKVGLMLVSMSTAILILTAVLYLMSYIPVVGKDGAAGLVGGLAAVMTLLYGFERIIVALSKVKKLEKVMGPLIVMTVAIGLMAVAIAALAMLDPKSVAVAGAAFTGVMFAFAAMIKSTKSMKTSKGSWLKVMATLVVMGLIVGYLAMVISQLTKDINPSGALPAVAALSSLLITLCAAFRIIKTDRTMSKENMTRTLLSLIVMTALTGALAEIIKNLTSIPNPESAIYVATALSGLMLALSASFRIIKADRAMTKENLTRTTIMLGAMTGVLALIAQIVGQLSVHINPQGALPATLALSTLLLAMTAAVRILATSKWVSTGSLGNIAGTLVLLSFVLVILADIIATLSHEINPEGALPAVLSLSVMLLAMAGVTAILGTFGKGSLAAATEGVFALMVVVSLLTMFVMALGEFLGGVEAAHFEKVEAGLDRFIIIAGKIGGAIGAIYGGIVSGIGAGFAAVLPVIGSQLSAFAKNSEYFVTSMANVKGATLAGAGIMAGSILALAVADIVEGIFSLLQFGNDLPELGLELSEFAKNAEGFISAASNIKPGAMTGIKTLADAVLALTDASLTEALTFWDGKSTLGDFGAQLPQLGKDMSTFASHLGTFEKEQVTSIECAAEAIATIAGAAKKIPNEGGLLGMVMGENSLSAFGEGLPALARHLKIFCIHLGDFGPKNLETVRYGADAIVAMANSAQAIPNEGGWLAKLVGDNSLATFGEALPGIGRNLRLFSTHLGDFGEDQSEAIKFGTEAIANVAIAARKIPNEGGKIADWLGDNSISTFCSYLPSMGRNLRLFSIHLGDFGEANLTSIGFGIQAITDVANIAKNLPNEGGKLAEWIGDNTLSTFSSHLPALGSNLSSFAANLGTFGDAQIASINAAAEAVKAFAAMTDGHISANGRSLWTSVGQQIADFGEDLVEFCTTVSGIGTGTINSAVAAMRKIVNAVDSAVVTKGENIKAFGDSLVDIAKNGIAKFVGELSSTKVTDDVKNAAGTLMSKVVEGFNEKVVDVEKAAEAAVDAAVDKVNSTTAVTSIFTAAKDLVQGFANGIDFYDYISTNAARAMTQAAIDEVKETLDSNSPSKVFTEIGTYVPMGFAIGIGKLGTTVGDAAASMGSKAIEGTKRAIANIASAIDSDMDTQPTIRPVLDLGGVESGIGTINSMFGSQSVGVLANVNGISSMMNRNGQNGTNADVISAIDRLRSDIRGMDRASYTINGVTYDDGSNISDAVRTIVRAARIERRM